MGRIDNPVQSQNSVTPVVVAASADFNGDSHVDGADFLAWQRGVGTLSSADRSHGDSNADGDVDAGDLAKWTRTFGQAESVLAATAGPSGSPYVAPLGSHKTAPPAELVDAAMAIEWLTPYGKDEESFVVDESELIPPYTQTRDIGNEPISAAAAAAVFESLALTNVKEHAAVDMELDDDPLAVQIE
jgi:hypothetical protein